MRIGSIDTADQVLIVAEIGNNHEGRFDVAQEMVRKAAETDVDAVKFQTYKTELFQSPSNPERFKRLKGFELTYPQFEELAAQARALGLLFISTPLDLESAAFLEGIVDALKIASGDNDFYALIERAARSPKPLILSTGLSDAAQVDRTIACVKLTRPDLRQTAFLHCVSAYPPPPEQANLLSVPWLAERCAPAVVGYSDHTMGIEACVLATALGARVLEKHFTLDKKYSDFRDHQLSADPAEMKDLVRRVREARALLGSPGKALQPAEEPVRPVARRSIAAGRDLPAGHRLTEADLLWLRPAGELSPGQESLVVGRTLRRAVRRGDALRAADVD